MYMFCENHLVVSYSQINDNMIMIKNTENTKNLPKLACPVYPRKNFNYFKSVQTDRLTESVKLCEESWRLEIGEGKEQKKEVEGNSFVLIPQ